MKLDAQAIERIVAEVMRRLSQLTAAEPEPAPAVAIGQPAELAPPRPPADHLLVDARVVTMTAIQGRLEGIRRVVVDPRAVVTPSVKDELDKKRIRLERRAPNNSPTPATSRVTLVRCVRDGDAMRSMTGLLLPTGAAERVCQELGQAIEAAGQAVADPAAVALVLTDETLAACCLLNRATHVRAAQAGNLDAVRQAIAVLGANVLVVDPRDMTINQWNAIVKVFCGDLPRGCPPLLQCPAPAG
jgi:hypothetical protein